MSKKNKTKIIKTTVKPVKSSKPIPWIKLVLGILIFAAIISVLFGIFLPNPWLLLFSFVGTFVGIHLLRRMG